MKVRARIGSPSLDELRAAYRHARFDEIVRSVDALGDRVTIAPELALLRARVALKGDPAAALAYLSRHESIMPDKRARAECAMLAGVAFARLGDARTATARFDAAAKLCKDAGFLAELALQRASSAWIARKLTLAERYLGQAGEALSQDLRLEAAVLRGAIEAAQGNVVAQGGTLLAALDDVRHSDDPAVLPWAVIATQIAYLARELPGSALRDAAYAELDRVPWTGDLVAYRFTMTRALGWRYALDGNYFVAFRRFKDAASFAPSTAWAVMASCDRAYFAMVLGERRWSEQELSDAHELAARVSWQALDGEERFALLVLAELFAPIDGSLALAYIARYKGSGGRFAATLASRNDRRVGAGEAYAFGVVQAALGEETEARRHLACAFETYDAIGYDWRAGRAAMALADLTGDPAWRARGLEKLRHYPQSWLVRGNGGPSRSQPPELAKLTPAQRAVYEHLVRGRSTADIAAEQGRSPYTVRNHIKVIFKAFGVNSRPELLARVAAS